MSPEVWGAQCLLIKNQGKEEALIPLQFYKGITILECKEPTDEDSKSLPIFGIIDPECKWNAKELPTEEFNLELCNQALSLREQRRAKATDRAPGALWSQHTLLYGK